MQTAVGEGTLTDEAVIANPNWLSHFKLRDRARLGRALLAEDLRGGKYIRESQHTGFLTLIPDSLHSSTNQCVHSDDYVFVGRDFFGVF